MATHEPVGESAGRAKPDARHHVKLDPTDLLADAAEIAATKPGLLELSDRDMDALLDAIANPPPPNAAMRRSAARWRKMFEQG